MTCIVERCPSCGVEHDVEETGECEACGSPLRYWCRAHSREIGWLDGAACERCIAEMVRSTPPPPVRRVESPRPRSVPAHSRPPAVSRAPRPPKPAPAERHDPGLSASQRVLRNSIFIVLGGVAGGGVLAWGVRHPEEAIPLLITVLLLALTAGMLLGATELFHPSRPGDRKRRAGPKRDRGWG